MVSVQSMPAQTVPISRWGPPHHCLMAGCLRHHGARVVLAARGLFLLALARVRPGTNLTRSLQPTLFASLGWRGVGP